ncbi:hypothetical protein CPB86DRAFT_827712 [Serendipita vermifera]|nr:hypothetical protein CPB86DRAFT_827712 [Serendipita vermifera]
MSENIEASSSSGSPIERLPTEILGLVFEDYVDNDLSAWILTEVCPYWKQVAHSIPTLWNNIFIMQADDKWFVRHLHRDDDGAENYYNGNKQLCFEESHLSRNLNRCAGAPLNIYIRCTAEREEEAADVVKCISLLFIPSITIRMKLLSIYFLFKTSTNFWPGDFEGAHLHNLQFLSVYPQFPKLWTEGLSNAITQAHTPPHTTKSTSLSTQPEAAWPRLKSVDISADAQGFNEITHKISLVMELGRIPRNWPNNMTPRVVFPNLVEANVSSDPFHFRRIRLPSVQTLDVQEGTVRDFSEDAVPEFVSFPQLQKFRVVSNHFDKWLSNISAPNLKILDLKVRSTWPIIKPDIFKSIPFHTFTNVSLIILRDLYKYDVWITILDALPSVTRLMIWSWHASFEDICALIRRLTEFDGAFTCAPNLREFTLFSKLTSSSHSDPEAAASIKTMMQDLISTRETHNPSLDSFSINDRSIIPITNVS